MMRHGLRVVLVAFALSLALGWTVEAPASAASPPHCRWDGDAIEESERLLADRYRLAPHPIVKLPHDLSWSEDPLRDRNWQFQLHSLGYVAALLDAWSQTGDRRYRARATALLKDWIKDNPRNSAPTLWAWNDHSTSVRATELACAADVLGPRRWLRRALLVHGRTLASADFYVGIGNHALAQNVGLLDIGHAIGHRRWMSLARRRTALLAPLSISRHGVTNEQSVEYQLYNYVHYVAARDRFLRYEMGVPRGLERIDRMPDFLGHATLPNGEYETLGDSDPGRARPIEGTIAEFAATMGRAGPMPPDTDVLFRSEGYLFARTGWGEARPFPDEVTFSLRFGPRRRIHGHHDGGSVTLYGYGTRLLVDPGKYTYDPNKWRRWFMSRAAHNVVIVDDLKSWNSRTDLIAHRSDGRLLDTTVTTNDGYRGVRIRRRVLFSRSGYLFVEDRIRSVKVRRFSQLWHLEEGSRPTVTGTRIETDRAGGNLTIIQLAGGSSEIVTGSTDPIQGWVSVGFNRKVEAPVLITSKTGRTARFVTLLVPTSADMDVQVTDWRLRPGGWEAVVNIGERSEIVRVTRHRALIEPVDRE